MIKKFLSNAMLSLVMDKQAKEKYQAVRDSRKSLKGSDKNEIPKAPIPPTVPQPPSERPLKDMNREQLIRNAMAIHKKQTRVLDDLDPDELQKLQLLAMQAILGKTRR